MMWLEIDPNVVKPGWTPLLITIVLAAIIVGLFFSMRRQFRRIDVSQSQPGVESGPSNPATAIPQRTATEPKRAGAESAATKSAATKPAAAKPTGAKPTAASKSTAPTEKVNPTSST